jgi:outer membrane protein assembly factor BamB
VPLHGWANHSISLERAPDTPVSPLVIGSVAVFADGDRVTGLRLADGRSLWHWAGPEWVDDMWWWQGLVVVLSGTSSPRGQLTGLDAVTGAVRWTRKLPTGVYGQPVTTADGGLALVSDSELQVISLANGTLRWARRTGLAGSLAAGHGLVLAADGDAGQRLDAYDDRTGAVRWTFHGLPIGAALTYLTGRVAFTWLASGATGATGLAAFDLATGHIGWQFTPGRAAGLRPDGETDLLPARDTRGRPAVVVLDGLLWLVSLRDGHRLWTAPASLVPTMTSQIDGADLITFQAPQSSDAMAGGGSVPGLTLVSRDAATGALRWARRIPPGATDPAVPAGPDLVVRSDRPAAHTQVLDVLLAYRSATGRAAWRVTLPAPATVVPTSLANGLLVQAGYDTAACAMPQ